jgi:hypothetical protein
MRVCDLLGTLRLVLVAGLLFLSSCSTPAKVSLLEPSVNTVLLVVDTDGVRREVSDAALILSIRLTLLPLFTQQGRTITSTPAVSSRFIIFDYALPTSHRFEIWPYAISDSRASWPLDAATKTQLFSLLGYDTDDHL